MRGRGRGCRRGLVTTLAAAAVLGGGCASSGGGAEADPSALTYAESLQVDFSRMERTSSGLWIEELAAGSGSSASLGDRVRIHYIGRLPDGTVVDSSLGGDPVAFELGSEAVIRGWNEGIRGMRVGGQRKLVVRPGLAYGPRGVEGRVPPNSVVVFEIQLLDAN